MRIGYAVGYAGLATTLGLFALSELIAIITVSSFSAIVTNGSMAGGGGRCTCLRIHQAYIVCAALENACGLTYLCIYPMTMFDFIFL